MSYLRRGEFQYVSSRLSIPFAQRWQCILITLLNSNPAREKGGEAIRTVASDFKSDPNHNRPIIIHNQL